VSKRESLTAYAEVVAAAYAVALLEEVLSLVVETSPGPSRFDAHPYPLRTRRADGYGL